MQNKPHKYNGSGSHERAILHMIGQAVGVFNSPPTTAEIAAWMNVSKPTARKYLRDLEKRGKLIKIERVYRSNAKIHYWRLTTPEVVQYYRLLYKRDYELYAQKVMKLVIQ